MQRFVPVEPFMSIAVEELTPLTYPPRRSWLRPVLPGCCRKAGSRVSAGRCDCCPDRTRSTSTRGRRNRA